MNRRSLLHLGLGAGIAAALPLGIVAASPAASRRVLAALESFSRRLRIEFAEGEVRITASIDRLGAYLDPGRLGAALPATAIHAEGNFLRFEHAGLHYRVENLLPTDFDRLRHSADV